MGRNLAPLKDPALVAGDLVKLERRTRDVDPLFADLLRALTTYLLLGYGAPEATRGQARQALRASVLSILERES